jgi:putative transposase
MVNPPGSSGGGAKMNNDILRGRRWAAAIAILTLACAAPSHAWCMNLLGIGHQRLRRRHRELLRKIPYAETRSECERLRDQFAARYQKLYPKAVETLCRDWERMVTFYRFPKDHWTHLRTTNPVESPFSAVRLRTDAAKRYKKVASAEALIWKILMIAENRFRRLNSPELLEQVYNGQLFEDGMPTEELTPKRHAA